MKPQDNESSLASEISVKETRKQNSLHHWGWRFSIPSFPFQALAIIYKYQDNPFFSNWADSFLEWGEGQTIF